MLDFLFSLLISKFVGRSCFERDDFFKLLNSFAETHKMSESVKVKIFRAFEKKRINGTIEEIEKLYNALIKK